MALRLVWGNCGCTRNSRARIPNEDTNLTNLGGEEGLSHSSCAPYLLLPFIPPNTHIPTILVNALHPHLQQRVSTGRTSVGSSGPESHT
jgi:hypothetical protein